MRPNTWSLLTPGAGSSTVGRISIAHPQFVSRVLTSVRKSIAMSVFANPRAHSLSAAG